MAIILADSPMVDRRNCTRAAKELGRNSIGSARVPKRNPRERKVRAHLLPAVGSARASPSVSLRCVLESLDG